MMDSIELFPRAKRSGAPWKKALAEAIRDPDELIDILGLPDLLRPGARRAAQKFPLVVPRGFVSRMRRGDARDPLLLQVLPLDVEDEPRDGFDPDPLREAEATVLPGLLRKYEGRVLLIAAGNCAINCRYCFRRDFPYDETPRGLEAWRPAIQSIAADPTVTEVILSGGDPLVLSDPTLEGLAQELAAVPHLKRLRVHSRLPIVLPERVNPDLLGWLTGTRLTPVMVVHANHPAEIDGACAAALSDLVDGGILVLNQSVLLRGVNDSADTLARLSERLIELRVLPYYLHQLDPVRGAAHFHVDEARGLEIVRDLRRRLPGYAVPRYVRETPGAEGKTPIEDGGAHGEA